MEKHGAFSDRTVRVSRRALVAGLVIAPFALVACGTSGGQGASSDSARTSGVPGPTNSTAADESVRATCGAAEVALIALYDATIAAYPDADGLATIRDEHAAHLAALEVDGTSSAAPNVAQSQTQAIKDLQKAEQAAAEARTADCVAVSDSALARLIALIAASEASHSTALGGSS